MDAKPEIDVTLVSGRRPDLLAATLASFSDRLFRNFRIRRFIANVDPIWGDASEGDACEALIRSAFPDADITRPDSAGLGKAVQSVWSRTGDRPVLHMEDDWIMLADATGDTISPLSEPGVGMVALAHHARRPEDRDWAMRKRKIRVFGVTIGARDVNDYGTSPRFIAAGLAVRYADLLDPDLSPEKQVYTGMNRAMCRLQEQFRCRMVWTRDDGPFIEDIGREWRDLRNIRKINKAGSVRWTEPQLLQPMALDPDSLRKARPLDGKAP